jgi:hypothetical protein
VKVSFALKKGGLLMGVMNDNSDFLLQMLWSLWRPRIVREIPVTVFTALMWCGSFASHTKRKGHQGIAGDNLNFLQKSFLVHENTKHHVTFMGHFYEPERDVIVAFSFKKGGWSMAIMNNNSDFL